MIRLTRTNWAGKDSEIVADQILDACATVTSDGPFVTIYSARKPGDRHGIIVAQTPILGTLEIAFEEAA